MQSKWQESVNESSELSTGCSHSDSGSCDMIGQKGAKNHSFFFVESKRLAKKVLIWSGGSVIVMSLLVVTSNGLLNFLSFSDINVINNLYLQMNRQM
jgi:hypothetical protein